MGKRGRGVFGLICDPTPPAFRGAIPRMGDFWPVPWCCGVDRSQSRGLVVTHVRGGVGMTLSWLGHRRYVGWTKGGDFCLLLAVLSADTPSAVGSPPKRQDCASQPSKTLRKFLRSLHEPPPFPQNLSLAMSLCNAQTSLTSPNILILVPRACVPFGGEPTHPYVPRTPTRAREHSHTRSADTGTLCRALS